MTQRILLTAARSPATLDLARQLHGAGHKIFVTDTTRLNVARFSNTVEKTFKIPSPRLHHNGFIEALLTIIKEEKITLIIPIYEEIFHLAKELHRFPSSCQVFCEEFELLRSLHNKWLFYKMLEDMGIDRPQTFLIQNQKELENLSVSIPYALKPCYSRGSLQLAKTMPNQPKPKIDIEEHNPWIAQEWLLGEKFCTYSICQKGKIKAHGIYPVGYAIDGNSCLIFRAIEHPRIFKWIENFVSNVEFTGQIAFDFIEEPNGKLYAIECNPRATSGIHLFRSSDRLDLAFLNQTQEIISPQKQASKQLIPGMLLYGWKKSSFPNNTVKGFLKELFTVKDAVFCKKDPMPFLAFPIILTGIWAQSVKHNISLPAAFTFDYEWNGEN